MHRIDGAGATVDNKFTEGDPVGGIQATVVTDDWLNDMQEEVMSLLAAAAIAPVKGTQNQVLQAIRSITSSVVGGARNVRMLLSAASASATFTADQITVSASLAGQAYRLTGFNKTINLATTGAGGMDTGAAPVSGFVAIYAIYNPTTGVSALLGRNATSVAAPEIYGGANMPAGYTASALLSVWPTSASSQMVAGYQRNRRICPPIAQALSSTSILTNQVTAITSTVPLNAIYCSGELSCTYTAAASYGLLVKGDASSAGQQALTGTSNGAGAMLGNYFNIPLITPQTINVTTQLTAGSATYLIYVTSYEI